MLMRRYLKYILLSVICLGATGCADFLDKPSYSDYEEKDLLNEQGMTGLLNGIYDNFQSSSYYGASIYGYEISKGPDFFVRVSSGGSFERECRYSENTSSPGAATSIWTQIYKTIRTATDLIEKLNAGVPDMEDNMVKMYLGEAHGLRGLAYFDLMRLFAWMPRFSIEGGEEYEERYSLGVPILDTTDMAINPFKYKIRRATAADTYKYIENEFKLAKENLQGLETGAGHINYVAVCGLMARMYLYMERWDDVIAIGEEALAAAGAYDFLSYSSYKTSYYQSFNCENIWELAYTETDNCGGSALNYVARKETFNNPGAENDGKVSKALGYAAYGLFPEAQNILRKKSGAVEDVRGYLICDLGVNANPDYKGCRKYVGSSYHYVYNIPVIRLPEIYLTVAEAYLHLGNVPAADEYYKALRAVRVLETSGFETADPEVALGLLLEERRRELIMEGHTYWDYFRRGATMVREKAIENVRRRTVNFGLDKYQGRCQVIYPIPLKELEANVDIRDQQSPGYDSYGDVYGDEVPDTGGEIL